MKIKNIHNTTSKKSSNFLRKLRVRTLTQYKKVPQKRIIALSIAILVFGSVIATVSSNRSSALSTFTQTDWSGGVGSSTSNQYQSEINMNTASAGKLTMDGPTVSNWCNNATCDSNWTKRKEVILTNNGSATTNQAVYFTVNKMESMKSDLADLRFTDVSGTALTFYAADRPTTGTIAVWVKMSTLSTGANMVYMYYGNSGASSESDPTGTVDFYDNFSSGSVDASRWDIFITEDNPGDPDPRQGYTIENGEFTYERHNKAVVLQTASPYFDFLKDWTVQYDFVVKDNCTDGSSGARSTMTSYLYSRIQVWCSGNNKYSFQLTGDTVFDISTEEFSVGQKIVLRRQTSATIGTQFYYSVDNGRTFQTFSNYSVGINPYIQYGSPYNPLFFPWSSFNINEGISNVTVVENHFDVTADVGIEYQYGASGTKASLLNSAVIDFSGVTTLYDVKLNSTGSGNATIKIRGSTQSNMSDATEFDSCNSLTDGQNITQSNCVESGDTYLQYQLYLWGNASNDFEFDSVEINYFFDILPPTNASDVVVKKSVSGATIANGAWTNTTTPYISWTAGEDNAEGAGLAGYCVYIGTDNSADVVTTSGQITGTSPVDVGGACQYATADTFIDLSPSGVQHNSLVNGNTYYVIVKAIDNIGNMSTDTDATASFRVDNGVPQALTVTQTPAFGNSKAFTITWPVIPGVTGAMDDFSGVAGVKYCVTNIMIGLSGCDPSNSNWFGGQHTSGDISDSSDVIPFSDGTLTMSPLDFDRIDLNTGSSVGYNIVSFVIVDNAGNYSFFGQTTSIITALTSGTPANLVATPTSNEANEFSFTWDTPAGGVSLGENDYCWTVNDPIEADGSNCNWTGRGITQLANGPFATIQGANTFRVMTKNAAGNFSNQEVASVTFTASTTAPGPPQNTEISDVSTKATSTWKLAISWSAPDQVGAGVSSYKIFRSTSADGTYVQVGSTSPSNLSFIDSGLAQTDYYYHIKACDSANSCSVAGNVVTKKPTGRFTTPASLTADTNQPKVTDIGTKKATITWGTSRESDSKVAFGTKSGTYNPSEIGNSTQTTDHSVSLTNLQPGTTYYYVAKWTDEDGNTGASQERSFRTLDAPVVSDVSVGVLGVSSGTVSFTSKNSSKVRLYYGRNEGFGGAKEINTSTKSARYDIVVPELTDGTRYYYRLSTLDADGNEYKGDIRSFTTLPLPRITNLRFQPVEGSPSSTQKVSWTTNVPATSSISYGPVGQKPLESLKSDLVTEHEITISGLIDNTDYNLIARSVDASGNTATSDSQTFKTALDTRPPKISDVSIETTIRGTGSEAKGQVIVSWKTDEKATSQVAYGQGQDGALNSRTPLDDRLKTEHTVVLSNLSASSIYRIQAVNKDKAGNSSSSEDQTVIIGRPSDNVFSIIFKALESIFRF